MKKDKNDQYPYSHGTKEIMRALDKFFRWYKFGCTAYESEQMMRSSYGNLIGDSVMFYIKKNTSNT